MNFKPESENQDARQRSIWGPELVLVIALPVCVIIAGAITIALAIDHGFKADPHVKTDRFARIEQTDHP